MKNNHIKMSPEDELIFCCTRTQIDSETRDKIYSLLQRDLNWVTIIASVYDHAVIKLFYSQLNSIYPEEVPKKYLDILRSFFHKFAQQNLVLTFKLLEILELFESQGIVAISYKGPVLAQLAYGDVLLGNFDHLDLLIWEDDAQKVKELLLSQGYKLDLHPYPGSEHNFIKSQPENNFIQEDTGIIIKIRWKFVKTYFSSPHDLESLWNVGRLKPVYVNDFKVMALSPEDLLLILSIRFVEGRWKYLSQICDITGLIQRNDDLNWIKILEQSEKFRVKRILSINLSLGKELLGMKLPDEVLNRIESDKSARAISTSIKEKFYINKNISTVHKEAFSRFKVRENRLDGLKDYLKVQLLDELKLFGGPKERIPFIPTPEEVVNRMLELAEPGPGDIIYDLGCGDGRIVITAAREYGIPGVGVDLDPRCIEESRKNAKKEGVEHLTTFIKEDVMKVDISKATILALYMGFDTNIKLIPKIKKQVKPGTRIISHRFPMGEWNPVKSDIMYYKGTIVPIYLWKT